MALSLVVLALVVAGFLAVRGMWEPKPAVVERAVGDLASWPRRKADELGCLVEGQLGHRDARFNCALKGYKNAGDPCRNTDAYYEGPSIPDETAGKAHAWIEKIDLHWEHGDLQAMDLRLRRPATEAQVRELLGLKGSGLPPNILSLHVEACGKDETCVAVTGFDHMGAGDVDCGERGS